MCGRATAAIATMNSMNASSAEFPDGISEPETVGLEMTPSRAVKPPRVAASPVAIECKYYKTVALIGSDGKANRSSLVIGEVVGIYIDDAVIVDGMVDITRMRPIARLGYMDYCVVDEFFTMPRPGEIDPHADLETAAVAPKITPLIPARSASVLPLTSSPTPATSVTAQAAPNTATTRAVEDEAKG